MGYLDSLMARNERTVLVTRQHWLVLTATAVVDGLLAIAIVAVASLQDGALQALAVLAVFPIVHFVIRYLNWHNDQYIVTNRRVMEIHGVVNKRVSDSSLEKVNDVVLEQSILGRFLNYGTVAIITGSDIGVNCFKNINKPVRFKIEMLNQKEGIAEVDASAARARRMLTEEPSTTSDIPDLIAELDDLRRKGIVTDQEFEAKKAELLRRI
jgi:uncharacterized membrane protein YdbT with pleckstrin-like domain